MPLWNDPEIVSTVVTMHKWFLFEDDGNNKATESFQRETRFEELVQRLGHPVNPDIERLAGGLERNTLIGGPAARSDSCRFHCEARIRPSSISIERAFNTRPDRRCTARLSVLLQDSTCSEPGAGS